MTSDSTRYPDDRPRAATIRSRLMLEVASELVGSSEWLHKQVRIDLRPQGIEEWEVRLFGSDGMDGVEEVVQRRSDFAILNPATALNRVGAIVAGSGACELNAIATIPSFDQLGFAVSDEFGVKTVEELVELKPPVRLSLRGERANHAVHMVVTDTLEAAGASLEDVASWGGGVRYDRGIPHQSPRVDLIRNGSVTAVFDEGIYNWVDIAVDAGFRFLSVGDETLETLIAMGYRRGTIARSRHECLDRDISTVDFSGFSIFTRSDVPYTVVYAFCEAMRSRANAIPWQGGDALPLARMCTDDVDAPISVPFHPAAAAFWEQCGFLPSD